VIEQLVPEVKRVGQFAVMLDTLLGKGHYGKVFMAYEVVSGELKKQEPLVCKMVERSKLSMRAERMIKNEIANLGLVNSKSVINMR